MGQHPAVLGDLQGAERGSGQRREEGEAGLDFLSGRCSSWPALHTAKGSVPSWAWARRRQSQGGPSSLPAGRRCHGHFRDWQARGAGLSAPYIPLAGKALTPLVEPGPRWPFSQSP